MLKIRVILASKALIPLLTIVIPFGFCMAEGAHFSGSQTQQRMFGSLPTKSENEVPDEQLNLQKYIKIEEITPGMQAYCRTVYQGTKVEKFDLEVLSVIRDYKPGRDLILVKGTDKRFIHTGPVAGCSGSPVYIDGRMAGALAYTFSFSKDPIYFVTPIADMLAVGRSEHSQLPAEQVAFAFDFSRPLDLADIDKKLTSGQLSGESAVSLGPISQKYQKMGSLAMVVVPCPLVASSCCLQLGEEFSKALRPFGLYPVAGVSGSTSWQGEDISFEPGGSLAVPLVSGDISMTAVGTITEVDDDKIYAFGHHFLGYGAIDLPMATAKVHAVMPNLLMSFKLASAMAIKGALRVDASTGVYGQLNAEAKLLPLRIKVDRYNDAERIYNCRVAVNRLLTPLAVRFALIGAALTKGDLPPEHLIKYKTIINIDGFEPIAFENISTAAKMNELVNENISPLAILMNNPYKIAKIQSIDFEVDIEPTNRLSRIWSVDLSDTKVKPGESVNVTAVLESYRRQKKTYQYSLEIPENLTPGEYELLICGSYEYEKFLRNTEPYKFVPNDLSSLIEVVNTIVNIRRDRLYAILILPPGGMTIETAELPDLPSSKATVLADAKRTLKAEPYRHWLKKELSTNTVTIDRKVLQITVKK